MKTGTKSILFGIHNPIIHAPIVAYSYIKLYGIPKELPIWISFILHDIGYWGKSKMDDVEGEKHVELGAKILGKLFGEKWYWFSLLHSRFYAKRNNMQYSKLCVADKAAIYNTPKWLYYILSHASGEIKEYISGEGREAKGKSFNEWYNRLIPIMKNWVEKYKDIKEDVDTK